MKHQLIGIVIAAILALGLMGCESVNTQNANTTTTKATMSDSDLENAIKAKIDSDAQLKAAGLDVDAEAEKKTVTVSGTVETQALRTKAIDLAKSAQAGLVITDKIDVKPREITRAEYTDEMAKEARTKAKSSGENIGDSLDDAWIHTKIVAKLIGNATTPQRKINVDVVNNTVTLRGAVDNNDEKAEAERVAKATEGVKSVKNMLVVKKV
jgi:hyperosmotically inducible periplasmic protein